MIIFGIRGIDGLMVWVAAEIIIDFNWTEHHTHAFQINTLRLWHMHGRWLWPQKFHICSVARKSALYTHSKASGYVIQIVICPCFLSTRKNYSIQILYHLNLFQQLWLQLDRFRFCSQMPLAVWPILGNWKIRLLSFSVSALCASLLYCFGRVHTKQKQPNGAHGSQWGNNQRLCKLV